MHNSSIYLGSIKDLETVLESKSKIKKNIISETLQKNNNNISKTSNELKITRQSLQHKIKKYKLL